MLGKGRGGEMTRPLSRSGAGGVAGHSGDPTPDLEVEGIGGGEGEGCSAGTDPCVTVEQLSWGWQKGWPRGARWCQVPDRGSNH